MFVKYNWSILFFLIETVKLQIVAKYGEETTFEKVWKLIRSIYSGEADMDLFDGYCGSGHEAEMDDDMFLNSDDSITSTQNFIKFAHKYTQTNKQTHSAPFSSSQ